MEKEGERERNELSPEESTEGEAAGRCLIRNDAQYPDYKMVIGEAVT